MRHTRVIAAVIAGAAIAALATAGGATASPKPSGGNGNGNGNGSAKSGPSGATGRMITTPPADFYNQGNGTYIVYGGDASGTSSRKVYRDSVPQTALAAVTPATAAAWSCSVYVSDLILNGNFDFEWTTEQTCSGTFGSQFIDGEMMRSSGSSWPIYGTVGKWPSSGTTSSFVGVDWTLGCDLGGESHNYIGAGDGFNSHGSSGWVRSENQINSLQCGTEPA